MLIQYTVGNTLPYFQPYRYLGILQLSTVQNRVSETESQFFFVVLKASMGNYTILLQRPVLKWNEMKMKNEKYFINPRREIQQFEFWTVLSSQVEEHTSWIENQHCVGNMVLRPESPTRKAVTCSLCKAAVSRGGANVAKNNESAPPYSRSRHVKKRTLIKSKWKLSLLQQRTLEHAVRDGEPPQRKQHVGFHCVTEHLESVSRVENISLNLFCQKVLTDHISCQLNEVQTVSFIAEI